MKNVTQTVFEKYPSVEIVADAVAPQYRVKYIECVREGGTIRFEKHERIVKKENMEWIVLEVLGLNG